MKTHGLTIKISAKKPKNVRNCEGSVSIVAPTAIGWSECATTYVGGGWGLCVARMVRYGNGVSLAAEPSAKGSVLKLDPIPPDSA